MQQKEKEKCLDKHSTLANCSGIFLATRSNNSANTSTCSEHRQWQKMMQIESILRTKRDRTPQQVWDGIWKDIGLEYLKMFSNEIMLHLESWLKTFTWLFLETFNLEVWPKQLLRTCSWNVYLEPFTLQPFNWNFCWLKPSPGSFLAHSSGTFPWNLFLWPSPGTLYYTFAFICNLSGTFLWKPVEPSVSMAGCPRDPELSAAFSCFQLFTLPALPCSCTPEPQERHSALRGEPGERYFFNQRVKTQRISCFAVLENHLGNCCFWHEFLHVSFVRNFWENAPTSM